MYIYSQIYKIRVKEKLDKIELEKILKKKLKLMKKTFY
jgi:hypothetical protein